ncbi:GDSL-type esterase/lipase family protein [Solitalea canadensis]|nr:GDSL-type esterase/lipase family protein [Solitalea canadensis]
MKSTLLISAGILCCNLAARAQQPVAAKFDTTFHTTYYDQKRSLFELLPDTKNEIIFLGNSITDIGEWAELFQNPSVKNRGISSDITFGVIDRLPEVLSSKPAKIFYMIGINDIAKNIPDSVILANHQRIVSIIKQQSPTTKIYIQSLLPTNNEFIEFKRHQNKTEHIIAVNDGLRELAKREQVTFIDLYPKFIDENGKLDKKYTNDGLHLKGAGYIKWVNILKELNYCCDDTPTSANVSVSVSSDVNRIDTSYANSHYRQRLEFFKHLPNTKNEIVFLGNSITEMGEWQELIPNKNVVNRGISGDVTYGIYARLDEVLASKPLKLFLMDGVNDIKRGTPVQAIADNIQRIIEKIQKVSPKTKIYLQSTLPVNESVKSSAYVKVSNEKIQELNELQKKLANQLNITYIDVQHVLSDSFGQLKREYTSDGIHLVEMGYVYWVNYLKEQKYL